MYAFLYRLMDKSLQSLLPARNIFFQISCQLFMSLTSSILNHLALDHPMGLFPLNVHLPFQIPLLCSLILAIQMLVLQSSNKFWIATSFLNI
jgi:hypothetical protein